jgi:hypothetical protein
MGGSGLSAANTQPDDAHVAYTVKAGDVLSVLAQQFLQNPAALQTVARINRIANIHRVSAGRVIKIPRDLLKYVTASAQVTHLRCTEVLRLDGPAAQEIRLGSTLTEGAVLRIPPGCQFTMTLEDNASVRLLSGAVVRITTLRRNAFDPSPEVTIDLLDGRAYVNVPQKRPPGDAPFRVLTPTSVAGIRGTQFRVGFDSEVRSSQLEVVSGAVAAQGRSHPQEHGRPTQPSKGELPGGGRPSVLCDGQETASHGGGESEPDHGCHQGQDITEHLGEVFRASEEAPHGAEVQYDQQRGPDGPPSRRSRGTDQGTPEYHKNAGENITRQGRPQ